MGFFRPLPDPLPGAKTYIYKTVGALNLEVDVFTPTEATYQDPAMVALFIHGGAWVGGSKTEYCRPLFNEFLSRGCLVASAEYRLLPESSFVSGQLEDIRDLEPWLRQQLPRLLEKDGSTTIQVKDVIVIGASAGAHLALLTPKLWRQTPAAILSIYGPTNLHQIPPVTTGPAVMCETSFKISSDAIDMEQPISSTPHPASESEFFDPRRQLGMQVFRWGLVPEFLLCGLIRHALDDGTFEWRLPEKGMVTTSDIDSISPLHLSAHTVYPPTYQILGSQDDLFSTTHATSLAESLERQQISHEEHIVDGANHAFDLWSEMGDQIHLEVMRPAVDWIIKKSIGP